VINFGDGEYPDKTVCGIRICYGLIITC